MTFLAQEVVIPIHISDIIYQYPLLGILCRTGCTCEEGSLDPE